ncbi:MAG: hypothetical protein H0T69_11010 [Thermoleophilaceae bacterium]|nr:hypothetical protein [Thermoleophilaceae bacterium]
MRRHGSGAALEREHAALAPLQLGVRAVFADRAEVAQTWTLRSVGQQLRDGADEITVRIEESDDEFALTHDFAAKEREILLHGGLLHYLKEQRAAA